MTEQEIIAKLEELIELKEVELAKLNYEEVARIRDKIRKLTTELEYLMNTK
jgi:protein-arginine kinase activator protein McsA